MTKFQCVPGLKARAWSTAGTLVRRVAAIASRVAAVGPNDPPAQHFGRFGDGTLLGWPTGSVFGERWIWIGCDTLIAPHVTLSAGMGPGQEMVTEPVVRIGDRCLIGRGTALVGHLAVDIGDDVYPGMNVYITAQNHGYEDIDLPIGVQTPSEESVPIGPHGDGRIRSSHVLNSRMSTGGLVSWQIRGRRP